MNVLVIVFSFVCPSRVCYNMPRLFLICVVSRILNFLKGIHENSNESNDFNEQHCQHQKS